MLSLFHAETDTASDTVLAPPAEGAAVADRRDAASTPSTLQRTLATLTAALSATRRGFGD